MPNQRGSNEEVVNSDIGQVGTQFDGFAHQTHGDSLYEFAFTMQPLKIYGGSGSTVAPAAIR